LDPNAAAESDPIDHPAEHGWLRFLDRVAGQIREEATNHLADRHVAAPHGDFQLFPVGKAESFGGLIHPVGGRGGEATTTEFPGDDLAPES
jgi:hypothetical protein